MPKLQDRLHVIREARLRNFPTIRSNAVDPVKDRDGRCTASLASNLRFLAIADLVLDGNVNRCCSQLIEAAELHLSFFNRFDQGESISHSFLTMLSYQWLFTFLAAGDFKNAERLAAKMDGREEISKQHDHPFDRAMGLSLQAVVLKRTAATAAISQLTGVCTSPKNKDFRNYAPALAAILSQSDEQFNHALTEILVGHKRQSSTGVFANTEDEVVAIWPLGLVNLARHRGLNPKLDDPLIPQALWI